jgi:hypothetical protein
MINFLTDKHKAVLWYILAMLRREAIKTGVGFALAVATGTGAVSAESPSRVLFLRGYGDPINVDWFRTARNQSRRNGFILEMVETPPIDEELSDDKAAKRLADYLNTVDQAVTQDSNTKALYGISAGGGGIEMYIELVLGRKGFPMVDDRPLINEFGILSARNLYDYRNLRNKENIPAALTNFYQDLQPGYVRALKNWGLSFKVAYGANDREIPTHNSEDIAKAIGTNALKFNTDHMGIVTNPGYLNQVLRA